MFSRRAEREGHLCIHRVFLAIVKQVPLFEVLFTHGQSMSYLTLVSGLRILGDWAGSFTMEPWHFPCLLCQGVAAWGTCVWVPRRWVGGDAWEPPWLASYFWNKVIQALPNWAAVARFPTIPFITSCLLLAFPEHAAFARYPCAAGNGSRGERVGAWTDSQLELLEALDCIQILPINSATLS